ncbi:hypothetical protein PSDVSF_20250 [Pseudodesulfovibrio sediminis]|uniref:Secreted protein n=1 Tax=Pseudodesulfovibrio sediminis TaxID=2810563 RepID=A0ABN6EV96_9BACT|nr:hypothetical protein PSDVSF_20250 [Pseudodesulfovibrio sediminis]
MLFELFLLQASSLFFPLLNLLLLPDGVVNGGTAAKAGGKQRDTQKKIECKLSAAASASTVLSLVRKNKSPLFDHSNILAACRMASSVRPKFRV